MTLARYAADQFEFASKEKGQALFDSNRVWVIHSAVDSFGEFRVQGTKLYVVRLTYHREANNLGFACSCPHFANGANCKHVWAAVLFASDSQLFQQFEVRSAEARGSRHSSSAARKGYGIGGIDASGAIAGTTTDAGVNADINTTANAKRLDHAPPKPDWRVSIERAERRVESQKSALENPYKKTVGPQKIAHYAIQLSDVIRSSKIEISFFTQDHLKNGSLGVLKSANINQINISSFADEKDAAILWALLGKSEMHIQQSHYSYQLPNSATIAKEHADEILTQISATGRFYLSPSRRDFDSYYRVEKSNLKPYAYQSEKWAIELNLAPAGENYLLTGRLASGEQKRPIKDLIARAGRLIFFDEFMASSTIELSLEWLEIFKKSESLVIPQKEIDEFLAYFYRTGANTALNLPDDIKFETPPPITPKVRLTVSQVESTSQLKSYLEFEYLGEYVRADSPVPALVQVAQRRILKRNFEFEATVTQKFQDLARAHNALALIEQGLELGWQVVAYEKSVRRANDFHLKVSSGVDWFDVSADFNFDGQSSTLPQLIAAIQSGQRLVQLGDGTYGVLPLEWLKKFGPIAIMGADTEEGLRLNPVQALFLSSSLEPNDKFKADKKFASLKTIVDDFNAGESATPTRSFQGRLRKYQKQGLAWLQTISKHNIGGILADDMGLGKTIQILALLAGEKDQSRGSAKLNLIVAPKSLIFNWQKEIEKFTPSLKALNFTGSDRHGLVEKFSDYDIILTTYQTLRRDIEKIQKITFDYFILDEAHFIKNPEAQASMACRLVSASKKISLSGTPVENSLADLFSILSVVNPGLISDEQAAHWCRSTEPKELQTLSRALRPFILRRTKDQVLKDLPSRTEQILYCELTPKERRHYTELKNYYWEQLSGQLKEKGLARSKIKILEALLRLRQAACHQGLIDKDLATQSSAKFDLLFDQLSTIIEDGHKVLIFSQFTSLLGLLSRPLEAKGIRYEYLDGKTKDRAERVEKFQSDPAIKVFLLSLKAGGVGLNLTAADYVFVLDPWWNPQAEAQAIDRAHRIGQTKKVFAYKIIAKDTVEEKILEMQNSKKQLAASIVSQEKSLLRGLKLEDLQALFS